MLERATLRRTDPAGNAPINSGLLAEVLLYYSEVELLLDVANLSLLIRTIGPETFQRLVELPNVKAISVEDNLAVQTDSTGIELHNFVAFSFFKSPSGKEIKTKEDRLFEVYFREMGDKWDAKRAVTRVLPFVTESPLGGPVGSNRIIEHARIDLLDAKYVENAATEVLLRLVPNFHIPQKLVFRPHETDTGYIIETNLSFSAVNAEYHKVVPPSQDSLSSARILSEILEARAGLTISAQNNSDAVVTVLCESLMKKRVVELVKRAERSKREIEVFQEYSLSHGKALQEAINSGERSFSDFLNLMEAAGDFKAWVKNQPADAKILEEYIAALSSQSWIDLLPSKALRFTFFSGAGIAADLAFPTGFGIIAGTALGAADAFLLDRLIKGWKPNYFVNGPLSEFVDK